MMIIDVVFERMLIYRVKVIDVLSSVYSETIGLKDI